MKVDTCTFVGKSLVATSMLGGEKGLILVLHTFHLHWKWGNGLYNCNLCHVDMSLCIAGTQETWHEMFTASCLSLWRRRVKWMMTLPTHTSRSCRAVDDICKMCGASSCLVAMLCTYCINVGLSLLLGASRTLSYAVCLYYGMAHVWLS